MSSELEKAPNQIATEESLHSSQEVGNVEGESGKLRVSIIICTYNRPDSLSMCLDSIEKQTVIPYEVVIVVDGGMTSEVQQIIDTFKANDRFPIVQITNTKREGAQTSMKIGAKAATGEIISYIDDDVTLVAEWLAEIIRGFQENEDAVGVGGQVINVTPFMDNIFYKFFYRARLWLFRRKIGKISFIGVPYASLNAPYDGYKVVDYLGAGNMALRREVFDSHEFDPLLNYVDDLNLGIMITRKQGGKLIYNSKATLYHYRAQIGHARGAERLYLSSRDHTIYLLKNFNLKYLRLALFSIYVLICALAYHIFTFSRPSHLYLGAIVEGIKRYKSLYRSEIG